MPQTKINERSPNPSLLSQHWMLNLQSKLKKRATSGPASSGERPVSIRDQLLRKELPELESIGLSGETKLHWDDPNALHQFTVIVRPNAGIWKSGRFRFRVIVPDDYNNSPPSITCLTPVWHPNISEDGQVRGKVLFGLCFKSVDRE